MSIDINKVIADMLAAIKGTVVDKHEKIESIAKQFLIQNKETLLLIAELRISGELDDEDFKSRMEDQKLVLEAQFNALQVISKAIAQQAANAAIDVLEKAIITVVKGVL
ncbi:MAG: hypothetical protein PHS84_11100 [Paludibacter sp.]|jgi:hypothetical protein|nr:hypothetical protein [Paludibacter sp.]